MQAKGKPTLGSTDYTAENPPFGATFTYYVNDLPSTTRQRRDETERSLRNQDANIPIPGWDKLQREATEGKTRILLVVRDARGEPVRWVAGPTESGLHRVSWDLRRPAPNPVRCPCSSARRAPTQTAVGRATTIRSRAAAATSSPTRSFRKASATQISTRSIHNSPMSVVRRRSMAPDWSSFWPAR